MYVTTHLKHVWNASQRKRENKRNRIMMIVKSFRFFFPAFCCSNDCACLGVDENALWIGISQFMKLNLFFNARFEKLSLWCCRSRSLCAMNGGLEGGKASYKNISASVESLSGQAACISSLNLHNRPINLILLVGWLQQQNEIRLLVMKY